MKVIKELFSDFTKEEKIILYHAILMIEDNNQVKTFLTLFFTHCKCWLKGKIDNTL